MYTKTFAALVAATLVGQAVAGPFKHGHQHGHLKRAVVTDQVTVTDWVTVTVYDDGTTPTPKVFYGESRKSKHRSSSSTSTSSSASSSPPPPSPSPVVSSTTTTIVAQVTSTSAASVQNTPVVAEAVASPSTSSEAAVINTPAPPPPASSSTTPAAASPTTVQVGTGNNDNSGSTGSGSSTGNSGSAGAGGKRGLVYNNPSLLKSLLNAGTKVSWTYNWGQSDDSGTDLEFVPMLWGLKAGFPDTWSANAQKAINAGSKYLFSFNEPELSAQANMPAQVAAQKHIELMNPFSGKAGIGAPAITNGGGPDNGIGYLKQFFTACADKCVVDFVNVHIYGVDTNTFLSHLLDVHSAFNKPVWITEFAFDGTDDQINSQLETVIDQIENNATYSFVQRYSYFMVQDGTMVQNNSPSKYGNTFAYGS